MQRAFFPNVNEATIRVLSAEGCEVLVPPGQGCCGALSLHSGRLDEAKAFARALIARFEREPVDAILVNAAGCGSSLKEYGELFAADAAWRERAIAFADKVRDVTEYLATLSRARRAGRSRCASRITMRVISRTRSACARSRGRCCAGSRRCELLEIPDGEQCCGSAGTYNLFQPESAHEIGVRKVENVRSVAPDLVASANPGCTLQMQSILRERGVTLRAAHPIELLDASINGRSTL